MEISWLVGAGTALVGGGLCFWIWWAATTANRLGVWSSAGLVAIGMGYAVALVVGFARHGF